jgi:hypothetical protein
LKARLGSAPAWLNFQKKFGFQMIKGVISLGAKLYFVAWR